MATRHLYSLSKAARCSYWRLPPTRASHHSGGTNLEIFKFGMYIMFPIGWMYYFGVNLDTRFSVPDFWPEPGSTHKIPFEKEELKELSAKLKADRLAKRRRRLEREEGMGSGEGENEGPGGVEDERGQQVGVVEKRTLVKESSGTFGVGSIERWARGKWRD